MENNEYSNMLAKNTLDSIPDAAPDARSITGLVKNSGKVCGYRLSDNTILDKSQAIELARSGGIQGVGVSHRGDTEYLKSIPDGIESNNLSNLPTV